MKNCILVFISLFLFNMVVAQGDEKVRIGKPISTGYVFIDGKYIEPPYKIEQKETGYIYINNKLVMITTTYLDTVDNPYKQDKLPKMPDELNKYTTFEELGRLLDKETGKLFMTEVGYYYNTHYPEEKSVIEIKEFYKLLPNVKSVEGSGGSLAIETYSDTKKNYVVTNFEHDIYKNYGIYSHYKPPSANDRRKRARENMAYFCSRLNRNDILCFFNKKYYYPFIDIEFYDDLEKFYSNKMSSNEKENLSYKIINEISIPKLDSILNQQIFHTIYNKLKEKVNKTNNNKSENKNKGQIKNKSTDTAYSPKNRNFYSWCPCATYDPQFSNYYNNELANIKSYIEFEDFTFGNDYIDNTPADDNFGNCTYQNILFMANAGFLYMSTHGRPPNDSDPTHLIDNGLFLAFATSQTKIDEWSNDNDIFSTLISPTPSYWSTTIPMWGAFAHSDWPQTHWKSSLSNNNSIAIISACYSYTNGWVEQCTGGVAFGYDDVTNQSNTITNNEQLFKRMNGTIGNGQYREAIDAYNNMPNHYHGFTYISNVPITLCPAPKSKNPDNNATVGLQGDGWFETDTYCDATVPINDMDPGGSPIAFEWTNSGLSFTNVHWDDPDGDGLSNKIVFHWESSVNNMVTVNINHNYWQSAPSINGQHHLLDYDKVTPNSEDGQYSFNISNTVPTQAPVADFIYTISGNTVYFQDQSTYTPTSWQWDFGDGQTSTVQNVSHIYSNTGTYSVTLTVKNLHGSSSKTQSVSITSTPQTIIVSGHVYKGYSYVPLAGATVFCNYGSTTTDGNGYYSLQVPYNSGDCGNITAAASGYQSSSTCSCKYLITEKSCDFDLNPNNNFYITSNPSSPKCNEIIYFSANNVPPGYDNYYWEFGDEFDSYDYMDNPNFVYSSNGNYTVTLTISNDYGDNISTTYNVKIDNCIYEQFIPSLWIPCLVSDINKSVTFYDNSTHTFGYQDFWKWFFDVNSNNNDDISDFYYKYKDQYVNPAYLKVQHAYTSPGRKLIKLQSYELCTSWPYSWFCDDKYTINNCTFWLNESLSAWAHLYVVNCNSTAEPMMISNSNYVFSNAIIDETANNPYLCYAGSFDIDGRMNTFLNSKNLTLSACNEVIFNGSSEFIADGLHELIFESGIIPNCNSYSISKTNDYKIVNNNSIEIYPNPCTDILNIKLNLIYSQSVNIFITDVLGSTLYEFQYKNLEIGNHIMTLNTKKLQPGIYFLKNDIENAIKFIKTN